MSTDPFAELHPGDGYRIERVELPVMQPTTVSLFVTLRGQGEQQPLNPLLESRTFEICNWDEVNQQAMGDSLRMELVLDAVCRYLTTGGSWEDLLSAVTKLRFAARDHLVFPGYNLVETCVNSEGGFQHVFADEKSEQGVIWVEDDFIERKPLEQIRREQEEDGWEDEEDGGDSEEASSSNLLTGPDTDDTGCSD